MNRVFENSKIRHLLVWMFFAFIISVLFSSFSFIKQFSDEFISRIMIIIILYIVPILWFIRRLQRNSSSIRAFFLKINPVKIRTMVASAIMPMIFGLGIMLLLTALFIVIIPETTTGFEGVLSSQKLKIWLFIFKLITLVFIGPVCEEIIFRGYLLGRLNAKFGIKKGIILSSIIFGVLHLENAFGITIFAIILSVLYIKTRSLIVPIIVHMSFNTIVAVRDIYFILVFGNQSVQSTETPLPLIPTFILSLILIIIGLLWIIPFLKNNWKSVEKGYPII
ncbi:CPBP family intramembrane glutamic endopeptidase [Psychrobacillus sp. L3]|uniref:CPBP family intramembrane glutamic endopeptidase n=1 Tax=Psychrobacillus sp. L3 TaxID=3236891 RepID=UPI0036F215DF